MAYALRRMLATYHNHSTWSDGKATIAELIDAARAQGIDELGISDHWVLHPRGTQFKWAMPTDRLADYVSELRMLSNAKPQAAPVLRLGLEVDWHPAGAAHTQRLSDTLANHPFDYIIGSVHEIQIPIDWNGHGAFMIDGSSVAWQPLTHEQINHVYQQYWKNVHSLAQSGVFDIVAHIDLPKKFAFYPTCDLSREVAGALDAIASARTASDQKLVVEINTAGWHKPCADAYPTLDILRQCFRREIPVTISADAHHPDHLLRDFDKAAARLAEAGYRSVARFSQRECRMTPLAL